MWNHPYIHISYFKVVSFLKEEISNSKGSLLKKLGLGYLNKSQALFLNVLIFTLNQFEDIFQAQLLQTEKEKKKKKATNTEIAEISTMSCSVV